MHYIDCQPLSALRTLLIRYIHMHKELSNEFPSAREFGRKLNMTEDSLPHDWSTEADGQNIQTQRVLVPKKFVTRKLGPEEEREGGEGGGKGRREAEPRVGAGTRDRLHGRPCPVTRGRQADRAQCCTQPDRRFSVGQGEANPTWWLGSFDSFWTRR